MPPRRSSPPPPPPRHSRPPPPRHSRPGGKGHALDGDAIDAALAEIVPDARDREFVLRCVLEEGPRHHRVASWALLRMVAALLAEVGGADPAMRDVPAEPVGMRLPPKVASASDDAEFPIGIPTTMLREILDEHEAELALDSLRDGPPHHALANAVMTWLLEAVYMRLRSSEPMAKAAPSPRKKGSR